MDARYAANIGALTEAEQQCLRSKKVCVAGCGGLGGHVINHLARLGIGHITAVDFDAFEPGNLNRQLFSTTDTIGCLKVDILRAAVADINADITFRAIRERLCAGNINGIIRGHDLVMDALDTAADRLLLAEACEQATLPLVHGAVDGWLGQVAAVFPGDETLRRLYEGTHNIYDSEANKNGALSFTVAAVAAAQCAEAIKILTSHRTLQCNQLWCIDLYNNEYSVITL